MKKKDFQAFSLYYQGRAEEIISDVGIAIFDSKEVVQTKAIWDTGATHSTVTENIAKKLNMQPIGLVEVVGVYGSKEVNQYLADVYLPNNTRFRGAEVSECSELSDDGSVGMLIGMDIISMGDLSITNADGNLWFSFRVPSCKHIDYVKEHRIQERQKGKGFRQQTQKKNKYKKKKR